VSVAALGVVPAAAGNALALRQRAVPAQPHAD
jgi:hypothetical protein